MAIRYWLQAARPRTLPLALSGALLGSLLASLQHRTNAAVTLLCAATAAALQVFGNLANDYGDARSGADSPLRQGPERMVASGRINPAAMKFGLILSALSCILLGTALLATALPVLCSGWQSWLFWLLAGTASLAAAYCYTAGCKPYGYIGLGDLAVFVFFGLLSVCGSEFLHTGRLNPASLTPAAAMGLWCCMILNLNNMRDINSDLRAGKHTVAARLRLPRAKRYHTALATTSALLWCAWLPACFHGTPLYALQTALAAASLTHLYFLKKAQSPSELDKLLPQWSAAVLLWVAALWLCR